MKFSKVIGNLDSNLVDQAEKKLSKALFRMALNEASTVVDQDGVGGSPFIFALVYPIQQICTLNIATAATDGKRLYWNPKFVLKQSILGLRLVIAHEAWHSIYMHPQRRGIRNPKLWNIAVDYIVNGSCLDDLKAKNLKAEEIFKKNLGNYMTIKEYMELIKDPFSKGIGATSTDVKMPSPDQLGELTAEQIKEMEKREKNEFFFYADPNIADDMKKPELIYDLLYALLPKCEECGRLGIYKKPKSKKDKSKEVDKQKSSEKDDNPHYKYGDEQKGGGGDEQKDKQQSNTGSGGHCCGGCGTCDDGLDIFGLGGTLDDHMDSKETPEEMYRRISEAVNMTKKGAGSVPAGLELELNDLTEPKIKWQDSIKGKIRRSQQGHDRNDWNRFKTKPMFSGLYIPKRKSYTAKFACLLDTSGSMSAEDIAFGLSQLQALDDKSEGVVIPVDCKIYWDNATPIKKCNKQELSKVSVTGRGGTYFAPFFKEYKDNVGECDFLIIITDAYLMDEDISEMEDPGKAVYWIVTSDNKEFKAPFGKVFNLHND